MLTVIDCEQRVWDGGEWKSVLGLVHILSAELLLALLPPSFPLLRFLTAGAPDSTEGDVWVEEVSVQTLQLNQGLAWSGALGLPDLSAPRLTPQLHLSPGSDPLPY